MAQNLREIITTLFIETILLFILGIIVIGGAFATFSNLNNVFGAGMLGIGFLLLLIYPIIVIILVKTFKRFTRSTSSGLKLFLMIIISNIVAGIVSSLMSLFVIQTTLSLLGIYSIVLFFVILITKYFIMLIIQKLPFR